MAPSCRGEQGSAIGAGKKRENYKKIQAWGGRIQSLMNPSGGTSRGGRQRGAGTLAPMECAIGTQVTAGKRAGGELYRGRRKSLGPEG